MSTRRRKTQIKRNKRRRRHTHKKRYSNRMRGGEKIAAGTYGCVYKPPLRCQGSDVRPADTISKFLKKEKAQEEFEQYTVMKRIDPHRRFHLGIHEMCIPAEPDPAMNEDFREDCSRIWKPHTSRKNYRILNEPDGGFELGDVHQKLTFTRKRPKKPIHSEKWNTFFRGMERILYGLVQLKKHGYVHQDIKGENIVIHPNTFHFNYIDFGMLSKRTEIVKSILQPELYRYRFYKVDFFVYYPPELFILSNYPERVQSIIQHSITRPEKARQLYEKLKREYHTTLNDSDDKHTIRTREYDKDILEKKYQRSQYQFPETVDEYVKRYASKHLNEIMEKWDVYSLGYTLASLWPIYFDRPFTEEILPPPYRKHPFMELRTMIAKMISLDYRERPSPEEVYAMYRNAYTNLFESTLKPLYPSLRRVPPMIDRGSHSVSSSSSGSSGSSGSKHSIRSVIISTSPKKTKKIASFRFSKLSKSPRTQKIPVVSIPVAPLEDLARQSPKGSKSRLPVRSIIKPPSATRKRTSKPTRTSPPMTRARRRRLGIQL